jgi:hypothetical protein
MKPDMYPDLLNRSIEPVKIGLNTLNSLRGVNKFTRSLTVTVPSAESMLFTIGTNSAAQRCSTLITATSRAGETLHSSTAAKIKPKHKKALKLHFPMEIIRYRYSMRSCSR